MAGPLELKAPTPPRFLSQGRALHSHSSSQPRSPKSQGSDSKEPIPVIMVTDIGADIDDTLALFAVLGASDAIKLEAVVTSVNNGIHRGIVTRGFLRVLGIQDSQVEILPSCDENSAACFIPDSFPTAAEASLGDVHDTPRRIIEICRQHQDTGIFLFGIASLTPIAKALEIDMAGDCVMQKAIKRVYLQGNVAISLESPNESRFQSSRPNKTSPSSCSFDPLEFQNQKVKLEPDPMAYNFKCDISAARTVFKHLQFRVPFTVLGKFAAYKVPIRKGDFSKWTKKMRETWETTKIHANQLQGTNYYRKIPDPPDVLQTSKRQMKSFRQKNTEKFDQIYDVPQNLSQHEVGLFHWFDDLPESYVCSHPYDPLLGLTMINDAREILSLNGGYNAFEEGLEVYHCENSAGQKHVLVGNSKERDSVKDPEIVHDLLSLHISAGLSFKGPEELSSLPSNVGRSSM